MCNNQVWCLWQLHLQLQDKIKKNNDNHTNQSAAHEWNGLKDLLQVYQWNPTQKKSIDTPIVMQPAATQGLNRSPVSNKQIKSSTCQTIWLYKPVLSVKQDIGRVENFLWIKGSFQGLNVRDYTFSTILSLHKVMN